LATVPELPDIFTGQTDGWQEFTIRTCVRPYQNGAIEGKEGVCGWGNPVWVSQIKNKPQTPMVKNTQDSQLEQRHRLEAKTQDQRMIN
jgi:hypothetical protein